jgi:glycosyltransferase involved in cell wall biosynthesis
MKVLGLTFVRNAEDRLPFALDAMAAYCDTICAIDDRSTDGTSDILRAHPAVSNLFTVETYGPNAPWRFPEGAFLELLYRMADLYVPDWVVMLSDDEHLEPAGEVRKLLAGTPDDVAGLQVHLNSPWNDSQYPFMVPVMGQARSLVGRIWRYQSGLLPSKKRLHNSYFPVNIAEFGRVTFEPALTITHTGWSTLAERIAKVDFYSALDRELELNEDVPYDIGLLFGYQRHQVDARVQEYERRIAAIVAANPATDGAGDEPGID